MRSCAALVAIVLAIVPVPVAAAPAKEQSQASKTFREPFESGWAAAVRAIGEPGACTRLVGVRRAEALAELCRNLSESRRPMCRPDYTCDDLTGNIWGMCADYKWDPKVTRQTPRDPGHVPCLDGFVRFRLR